VNSVIGLKVVLPIRVRSEGNQREHHFVVHKRKSEQKAVVTMSLTSALRGRPELKPPFVVTMTRIGLRTMDDDNVAFAFKACRDAVAACLGIDDGDVARIRFRYGQRKAKEYGVEILVESLS
jgi:hypothetical protein